MVHDDTDQDLELTYTGVSVYKKNHVIIPCVFDEFVEDGRDHALVAHWIDGEWFTHLIDDNSICGVCAIEEPRTKVLNVGVDGRIDVAILPGFAVENVDPSELGPTYSTTLRCVRRIGKHVYVAGMARQCYRRESTDRWVRWDNRMYQPPDQRIQAVGILDIDGTSQEKLLAVGYKGEIWFFDGSTWRRESSPVNVALACVESLENGVVYIGGLEGTIVKGTPGQWEVLDQEATEEDFWGVEYFKGTMYFSNYDGVFTLQNEGLVPVEFGFGGEISTAYLSGNDEVLWSVGHKHIAWTEDGTMWVSVEGP